MPTYNAGAVSDTAIAYQKPITLQQGRGLRDNPLAVAEASSGAPVVQTVWHPYNMNLAGTGDGEIWSFAADGAVSSVETPDFADGWEYQILCDELSGTVNADFRVGLYLATTAAYIDVAVALSVNAAQALSIQATAHRPRDISRTHALEYLGWKWDGTSDTGGGMNTFSIQNATAQKIGKARVSPSTGNFDAGRIRLFRRKLYG